MPWTYVISDLNGEEIVGRFFQKELQKQIKNSVELKRKGNKLYVEWKCYDISFNS